jgi:hypothetical protein
MAKSSNASRTLAVCPSQDLGGRSRESSDKVSERLEGLGSAEAGEVGWKTDKTAHGEHASERIVLSLPIS